MESNSQKPLDRPKYQYKLSVELKRMHIVWTSGIIFWYIFQRKSSTWEIKLSLKFPDHRSANFRYALPAKSIFLDISRRASKFLLVWTSSRIFHQRFYKYFKQPVEARCDMMHVMHAYDACDMMLIVMGFPSLKSL